MKNFLRGGKDFLSFNIYPYINLLIYILAFPKIFMAFAASPVQVIFSARKEEVPLPCAFLFFQLYFPQGPTKEGLSYCLIDRVKPIVPLEFVGIIRI